MNQIRLNNKFLQVCVCLSVVIAFNNHSAIHADPLALHSGGLELQGEQWAVDQLGDGLSERDAIASQVVAEEFSKQISNVEWLAPLAPIAISPFFGITLLSGLACFGPEWLPDNALLSEGSPLANPNLFWVFLVLTALTSAPRFSKVSKPVAQMADFLETYSAIVILLVLKVMSMESLQPAETEVAAMAVGQQSGIFSMGWEGLMMIAMVINIIVVNSVKFFFEILVWITPIPFLDACFEVANKTLCAGLMAIYALSPLVALLINLALFVCCAFAFTWIRRREIFYRTVLVDWVWGWFKKSETNIPDHLIVFPKHGIGAIPARAKCKLEKIEEGWQLTHQRLLRAHAVERLDAGAELDPGWWTTAIVFENGNRLTLSSKFNGQIAGVSEMLGIPLSNSAELDQQMGRQVEFA